MNETKNNLQASPLGDCGYVSVPAQQCEHLWALAVGDPLKCVCVKCGEVADGQRKVGRMRGGLLEEIIENGKEKEE